MWGSKAPAAALAGLLALTMVTAKPYPVEETPELQNATQLEPRQKACGQGFTACGWYGAICCSSSEVCTTNANNEAICAAGAGGANNNGQWTFITTYYTATDLVTRTSVYSSFIGGAAPAGATPQPTASCTASQSGCGSTCCDGGYYCFAPGVCKPAAGSTPGASGIVTPSAPLRPTSSTLIVITATGSPTTTVPFTTPIPTGATGQPVEQGGGGGLSGGAIAGIVIGVIAGIILLLLICFYCCAKAAFDSVLAIFGLGGKRRRKHEESTYIEEHHRHGSAAAGGGRWYGQGSSRPSRPPKEKKSSGMGNLLGVGAGLAGLAAVLGMKRKHDQRHDEKTDISSSYYSYSDYTSTSSASSDDRRTRNTRHSSRR